MNLKKLPLRNLLRRPGRTWALLLLTGFLALSLFAGSVVVLSLKNGLNSLESRLGADIIVVPVSASAQTNLEQMLLQGTTGYFYMNRSNLEKIRATEGVEEASPQLFLASLRASCCSVPIQVIGIEQESDFTIQPWIAESYSRELKLKDLAVGSRVSAEIGETIRIYNVNCPVQARLAETGTGLDTAVYCSMETLEYLLDAARELGHDLRISGDSAEVISAVYVRVRNGFSVEKVCNDLSLHIRKTKSIRTRSMFSDVGESLIAVSSTVTVLITALWGLALVLLLIVFSMMVRERRREFAVLRLLGTSRQGLSCLIWKESLLVSLAGGLAGIALGTLLVFPFSALIEQKLGLPYLTPSGETIVLLAGLTVMGVLLIASLASAGAAFRLGRVDPGTVLREGT